MTAPEVKRPPPTDEQRRAADPSTSVWVTASAGTGKTRVLADRVLRLLLAGVDPSQILCLTFTKAGAAEMVARIQGDLGRFATLPQPIVVAELKVLLDRKPTPVEIGRARALLAQILELPTGLAVMTIHGFCQSLMRRFPLEAGVPPHFEIVEPREAAALLREAQDSVLAAPSGTIERAIARLAVLLTDQSFAEALAELRDKRLRLAAAIRAHDNADAAIDALYRAHDLAPGTTVEQLRRQACADPTLDERGLRQALSALHASDKLTDRDRAATLGTWLEAAIDRRLELYQDYQGAFLTQAGEPQRRLMTKGAANACPEGLDALQAEQERLIRWAEPQKAAVIVERTAALVRVGDAVIAAYERRKKQLAALDYDDLIARAQELLTRSGATSWVHYKLDQQIDHILVDESQDTSPEQWAIIEALAAEFFAGEGAHPGQRTLFVVGDNKQSIFSFQGADLDSFRSLLETFRARAASAAAGWTEVPLKRSFRSAPAILAAVDATFAGAAADGVVTDAPLRHESAHADAPGLVELWPLATVEPTPKVEHWELPDRRRAEIRPEPLLARRIADQIFTWLRDRERFPDTGAPIKAGDIMILLPRRGVLQDLLIRELKHKRVPVAGADRMALTDEIAVMDLMALGDVLLLPHDDLTLAAVLKSPLFGLDEDDLFALAHDRGAATLFDQLRARRAERPIFAEAFERLAALLDRADYAPPFEFFARLLGEGGGRARILARLGHAALEPIEAFLAQALAHERAHPPSLQGFLHWLRADATDLHRDPDQPRDEVRVLTVHGAKGLEAPIVFLTDTTYESRIQDRLRWPPKPDLPVWKVAKPHQDQRCGAIDEAASKRDRQEYHRLLYVAMTRARNRLIVTGRHQEKGTDGTWYQLIRAGLQRLGAEEVSVDLGAGICGAGLRYGTWPQLGPKQLGFDLDQTRPSEPAAPDWLQAPATAETAVGRPVSPSRLDESAAPPAGSPLAGLGRDGYARGRLIHRLLQLLPTVPPVARPATVRHLLAQAAPALPPDQAEAIAAEVLAVLDLPGLAPLLGPDARAEVPIAGLVGDTAIVGQIDRLAVGADRVHVLDYKSDRSPPATVDDVPTGYLRQLAAYRALVQQIYPSKTVVCALLWTSDTRLMELDDRVLDRYQPPDRRAGPEA